MITAGARVRPVEVQSDLHRSSGAGAEPAPFRGARAPWRGDPGDATTLRHLTAAFDADPDMCVRNAAQHSAGRARTGRVVCGVLTTKAVLARLASAVLRQVLACLQT